MKMAELLKLESTREERETARDGVGVSPEAAQRIAGDLYRMLGYLKNITDAMQESPSSAAGPASGETP